ncbi:hypothetical protein [Nonlabens xiamenensis]|uniref:hypothetical protein n=1 Tax=Nonlabens xiamenensis TaxID=2341043 RepID=UPI000F61234C|nr:hypothetical protein [Nonlabens xiamenensis]
MIDSVNLGHKYAIRSYQDDIYLPLDILAEDFFKKSVNEVITIKYYSRNASFVELSVDKDSRVIYNISFITIKDAIVDNFEFLNNLTSYGRERELIRLNCNFDYDNHNYTKVDNEELSFIRMNETSIAIVFGYLGQPSFYSQNEFNNGVDYLIDSNGSIVGLIIEFKSSDYITSLDVN